MFAFAYAFLVVLAFLCVAGITGEIVVRSSTRIPAVLRPKSSSATVLARVDVCRARLARDGRAISFLVFVFAFALPLAFLERVHISSWHGRIRSNVPGRTTPLQQSCHNMGSSRVFSFSFSSSLFLLLLLLLLFSVLPCGLYLYPCLEHKHKRKRTTLNTDTHAQL